MVHRIPRRTAAFCALSTPLLARISKRTNSSAFSSRLGASSPVESEAQEVGARQPVHACTSRHKSAR
eukprot:scaffold12988_cov112-Isochrysis_galbana.AAC.2